MKKLFALLSVYLLLLAGCSTNSNSSGNSTNAGNHDSSIIYTMVLPDNSDQVAPYLSLDEKNKTFSFVFDFLSSYLPYGTYEINGYILTATTDDKKYTYLFKIKNDNTLEFIEDGSSKIKLIDSSTGVKIYDRAQFKTE